jgi:hypothetical protein
MIVECIPLGSQNATLLYSIINSHSCECVYVDYNYALLQNSISDIEIKLFEIYNKCSNSNMPVLIIDSSGEAPTLENFPFVVTLKNSFPTLNIVHVTTGWDKPNNYYTVVTNTATFCWPIHSLWKNKSTQVPTHHYIALARNPKSHRTRFVNSLLNKNLENYGYFSIGSGTEWTRLDSTSYYVQNQTELGIDPANLLHFPTLLDGTVEQNYLIDPISYEINDPRITDALVNVVLETSYEKISNITTSTWSTPMMTEKTVKAFALKQIPMILGPAGQVAHTQNLGFDMFNDIIDHSYDFETDPLSRINKFVNSLQNFITLNPTETLQEIKNKLMPRFEHNFNVAKNLALTNPKDLINPVLDQLGNQR